MDLLGSPVRHYVLASRNADVSIFCGPKIVSRQPLLAVKNGKRPLFRREVAFAIALEFRLCKEWAGGFEPSTCCLRISWLMVYHYLLVSMDVEFI